MERRKLSLRKKENKMTESDIEIEQAMMEDNIPCVQVRKNHTNKFRHRNTCAGTASPMKRSPRNAWRK